MLLFLALCCREGGLPLSKDMESLLSRREPVFPPPPPPPAPSMAELPTVRLVLRRGLTSKLEERALGTRCAELYGLCTWLCAEGGEGGYEGTCSGVHTHTKTTQQRAKKHESTNKHINWCQNGRRRRGKHHGGMRLL